MLHCGLVGDVLGAVGGGERHGACAVVAVGAVAVAECGVGDALVVRACSESCPAEVGVVLGEGYALGLVPLVPGAVTFAEGVDVGFGVCLALLADGVAVRGVVGFGHGLAARLAPALPASVLCGVLVVVLNGLGGAA